MDTSSFVMSLQTSVGGYLPKIAAAIGILIVGWLIAVFVRAVVRKLLAVLKIDQRIAENAGQGAFVERLIAGGLFWLVLLVTAVGIFNALNLYSVSSPLSTPRADSELFAEPDWWHRVSARRVADCVGIA